MAHTDAATDPANAGKPGLKSHQLRLIAIAACLLFWAAVLYWALA